MPPARLEDGLGGREALHTVAPIVGSTLGNFFIRRPPAGGLARRDSMEIPNQRCCGIDGYQATVVACVRLPGQGRRRRMSEVRTFETTTAWRAASRSFW